MSSSIYLQNYGIHTFMITAKLTYEKYRELKLILQKNVTKKRESDNESYIQSKYFATIGYVGITAKLYMQNGFARLEIIVNPSNLLNGEYLQTTVFSERSKCKDMVRKLNQALGCIKMDICMFALSRIDLCFNFRTNPGITEAYIKLGKKSYKSHNVDLISFDDESSDKHSLTLKCPSYEIEVYDKEFEIEKRTQKTLNEGYGSTLRIEARLSQDTIYRYIHSWQLASIGKILREFIYEEKEIMLNCIVRCFRDGAFLTLDKACDFIEITKYNDKTKILMIKLLKSKVDPDIALNLLKNNDNLSDKKIQRLQHKFAECNLNMVTIPVRMAKNCGEMLPGFKDLFN